MDIVGSERTLLEQKQYWSSKMRTRNEIAQDIRDLERTGTSERSDSLEYYHHKLQELFTELESCESFCSYQDIRDIVPGYE